MATRVQDRERTTPRCRLLAFSPQYADAVISWVRTPEDAYWLAPRTKPPLTPQELLRWQSPDRQGFMLVRTSDHYSVGYGELNVLHGGAPHRYWLGHLVVDPDQRGKGLGVQLTKLLLWRAYARHGAREVSLVVFPENARAIAAYESAGMRADGYETHSFPAYNATVRLLRMVAKAS